MAWLSVGFVISQMVLWYAIPGESGYIWLILTALIVATICGEYTIVLNNSLMPRLVPPEQLGRLSGAGWALGYLGGLISLVIMVGLILTDANSGRTMLGLEPLFNFDVASREADRFVGPFSALWYAVFVLPFFLFTPDAVPRPGAGSVSLRSALASLSNTLRQLRTYRDIVLFFVARMLFIDGLLAIFTFGGVYAATVFGWQTIVIGYFGIILAITAGIGALIGGYLDDRLGSKPVIIASLLLLIVGALGVISIDRTHVLLFLEVAPPIPGAAPFASTGEMVYIGFACLIGLASGPLQSASRSLLARMAPPEHMTEFFGFFAFSGKVTAFAAPFVIAVLSDTTGSLQIAMSAILVFLLAGLAIMLMVRGPQRAG
jgi:UMF1 family MFS transporter